MRYKRYEILLPLRYNTGEQIESGKFQITHNDLMERFGAISKDLIEVSGHWYYQGTVYIDKLHRWRLDIRDTGKNRKFLKEFKDVLKERFAQEEIWITATKIETI